MPLFIIELLEKWVDNKIEEYCIIFINMKMQKFVTRFFLKKLVHIGCSSTLMVSVDGSENCLVESVLSYYLHMSVVDQIQVARLVWHNLQRQLAALIWILLSCYLFLFFPFWTQALLMLGRSSTTELYSSHKGCFWNVYCRIIYSHGWSANLW